MIDPIHYPGVFQALGRFRSFYAELNKAAASVRDDYALGRPATTDTDSDTSLAAVRAIAQRLRGAIRANAGLAGPRLPDGGAPVEMGYVLAALADEEFLQNIDWRGKPHWDALLLEEQLYGSRIAGERLFELANLLIANHATGQDDLVVALLQAFTLGFRGRYRGIDDHGEIRRLRQQLYQLAFHQPPPVAINWRATLPGSSNPPLEGGDLAKVPSLRPWLIAVGAAVVLYLAVTHAIWSSAIGDALAAADRIVASGHGVVR